MVTWLQDKILQPEVQRKTRMDISSVAMAFGPCFLTFPEQKVEELVKCMQAQIKFTVNLLMLMNSEVNNYESKVRKKQTPTKGKCNFIYLGNPFAIGGEGQQTIHRTCQ